jgi:TPR repeat protein
MADVELLLRAGDAAEERGEYDHARLCFEQAAALGDSHGYCKLAYLYDVGLGVEVDKVEAMRFYRRAWRIDRSEAAANNIAILYRERGDRRLMFQWFKRGADVGDGEAFFKLAECYRDGVGVRRSVEQTVRCLAAVLSSNNVCEDTQEQAEAMMLEFRPRPV